MLVFGTFQRYLYERYTCIFVLFLLRSNQQSISVHNIQKHSRLILQQWNFVRHLCFTPVIGFSRQIVLR